jgi:8-oxo-dGTP pyrophosphatase MutT (NUDIX family)
MNISFDWALVRSFLAVLEQGSLLGAARQLQSSQPTIGRHVAELEKQLGLVLFDRTGRGLIPTEAALREAHEEIGIAVNLVDPIEIYSDQHDGWSYDTVISKAHKDLIAHEQNDESLQVEWVAFEDVVAKNLHPSFAKTWPVLLARLEVIFI